MQVEQPKPKHYQLFIIGGGSGGLAAAKWAARSGGKVGLADFVKPSPAGTKWGLGGTCVNVGCIPKKLMHHTSLLGEHYEAMQEVGWKTEKKRPEHEWSDMVGRITDYIRSLNFGYRKTLLADKVEYHNKLARLKSAHEIELKDAKGAVETVTADNILIATGGRPSFPTDIPNVKELSISSDDIFWMDKRPGKTLVVGASYIGLECAGFLHGLGVDVTVMVRSIFLRGFDQQLANKIGDYIKKIGIKVIHSSVPSGITKKAEGDWKTVQYKTYAEDKSETVHEEDYETIMFAVGRSADTHLLNLSEVGVKTAKNGKIICTDDDKTSVDNIYAIGDVVEGRLELTPTAIMAGRLLALRLFAGSKILTNYRYVPTTVFTPLEYGCCGYSEEAAIEKFGAENIVSYGSQFKPLEWQVNEDKADDCYAKLVIHKNDPDIPDRVIGFHYLGPEAGEVTQGFGVAIKKGISKTDLDLSVGIHPTRAEVLLFELVPQTVRGCDTHPFSKLNYVRGKKNGQGKFIWPEKTVYVGQFRDNIIEGYGRYQWIDGKVYEGQWKNNRINGSGTMTWPDGKKYVGELVNDKRQGEGTMTWPDHRKFEGQWRDGRQHGRGILVSQSGVARQGEWENGRRVRWLDNNEIA